MSLSNIFEYPKLYPPFGFESTWRYKNVDKQKQFDEQPDAYQRGLNSSILTEDLRFIKAFNKLKSWREVGVDPYNIEIPTNIITDSNVLFNDFNKLSKLMDKYGFIESSRSYNNNFEGGGHIHIDYNQIFGDVGSNNDFTCYKEICKIVPYYYPNLSYSKHNNQKKLVNKTFALFVSNMMYYMVNNPWIPWAFNAPHDNICAKNNLLGSRIKTDINRIKKIGLQDTRQFCIDLKDLAITLRPSFGTFEFRFFGMPKHSDELKLHIDLAQAIYKHCFMLAINGVEIKPKYANWTDLTKITFNKSINGLKHICKELKLRYSDLDKLGKLNNLTIRYAIHKGIMESEPYKKENMILN